LAEARSHFTLWSALKSPLLLGADVSLMGQPIVQILKDLELRAIHEDELGRQARPLHDYYPGFHSDTSTAAVLRPCDSSDPQQLWGSSASNAVDMPLPGVTVPPIPRVRNTGALTHCLSVPSCQPKGSTSPIIRQCEDWTGDHCNVFPNFPTQIFIPRTARDGSTDVQLVANISTNNSEPTAQQLCLSAFADSASDVPSLGPCDASSTQTATKVQQSWQWSIDPATSGDSHPDHPGTLIRSVARPGMCLATNFSEAERNEVYVGELANGGWVVVFFNRTPIQRTLSLELGQLKPVTACKWKARDIWSKQSLGILEAQGTLKRIVAAHDVSLIRLNPST